MMPGEQTRKPKPKEEEEEVQESTPEKTTATESTKEVDDLLDEIDAVLESNAEDFVRAFVQKGGE
jgi:prokaryotic ubiquitin-like protein Pup